MSFGFRKSFTIVPGVRLNVGKRSTGISFGAKGLRYSINSRTGGRVTASIPGTGLSYSTSTRSRNYNSNAYQKREELRRQKEIAKQEMLEEARYEVEEYENQIDIIKSIHKECDDFIDWIAVKQLQAPFLEGTVGPKQLAAEENLANYKPSLFDKLRKSEAKKEALLAEIQKSKEDDQQDYKEWEELVDLAARVIKGDIDSYFEVIDEMGPLDDLAEYGSGFEFFASDPRFLEVEFQVNSDNVIPKEVKSLTSTGKLSVKAMNKTTYFDLEQDYVCSCVLRIARDMFSLLPIQYIYIHATDTMINPSTGHNEEFTALSVKIDRVTLNKLNFENIDCSDAMKNFEHNMKFQKTSGFKPVNKLSVV